MWRRLFLIKVQIFYINGSGGVCYYLQALMEPILAKIQTFTINGSDEICDKACFFIHAVVVCF